MTSKSRASSCCPSAGSSNGRSVGSTEQDASPKTSRPPSTPRSHGSSSPSPSCSRDASPGSQVKKRDFRVGLLDGEDTYTSRCPGNKHRITDFFSSAHGEEKAIPTWHKAGLGTAAYLADDGGGVDTLT